MFRQTSWIEDANDKIKITDVLTSIGVFVPSTILNGGNKKISCPFGFYHSDGGLSRAMRVYLASNTAYCFSCSKSYSPVSLASAAWDISWPNAAFRLLEDAGFKPKTLEERWAEATTPIHNSVDLIALADALKTFCSGISPDWTTRQLDDTIAVKLNKCLELLDAVKTDEDAAKWLQTCKMVMRKTLEERCPASQI
jgi:hypothetical protein